MRPVSRIRRLGAHPAVPFGGIMALAFATSGLHAASTEWALVAAAGIGAALATALALGVPWHALPRFALLTLPTGADALIALLRHAQGGSTSGYAPLVILPVLWVGLTLTIRAVALMAASTCLVFALPIVAVGPPMYPDSGWRGVVLWTVVACVVGTAANRAVGEQRRLAAVASSRARELDEIVATQTAIATAEFELEHVLTTVVEEALKVTGAEGSLLELHEDDELVCRATAGSAAAQKRARRPYRPAGEQTPGIVAGGPEDGDRRIREACSRLSARSSILVPLRHGGRSTGVLTVYSTELRAFADSDARVLSVLADLIANALARAELVDELSEQAVTDELTRLPNRRAWQRELGLALARARRSGRGVGVVVLDLDGLKKVNDLQGHAAGDRLLIELAGAWSSVLRDGEVLGRIGGDEFALVLEDVDAEALDDVAARLERVAVRGRAASAGTAVWDGAEEPPALVSRADAAMYERKRARSTPLPAIAAGPAPSPAR